MLVIGLVVGASLAWAFPHFLRGFREAREQRGVDLNMQHRAEQELAEEQLEDAEWRRRIHDDLDHQIERWRQEDPS